MNTATRPYVPLGAAYAPPATLDLEDIQSLVLYPVAFPYARYCFFAVTDAEGGRRFVGDLALMVTDAVHPVHPPGSAQADRKRTEVSVAFTHRGLAALGLPARSLHGFPLDFTQGMAVRARDLLVDRGESDPDGWEPLWRSGRVHVLVTIQAADVRDPQEPARVLADGKAALDDLHARVRESAERHGVEPLHVQHAAALVTDDAHGMPTDKEHFGYSDGIGNPDIAGSGWPMPPGSGKSDGKGGWVPLAAGEFVLGHADESGAIPAAPLPAGLSRNGTYLVYRKLHEHVARFRRWLAAEGERYPGGREVLAAKLVGRFRDGTPLVRSPDAPWDVTLTDRMDAAFVEKLSNFTYAGDPEGSRCPMGAHVRRMNPRDSLGFDGVLVDQRRIARRGLPYGEWIPEGTPLDEVERLDRFDAEQESRHGVIFMAINASIERQFEFVQREWMNYGNDFRQGNDRDPLLGCRDAGSRHVIQGDASADRKRPLHVCRGLPQFVTVRGGEYFFVPSLTALGHIAAGTVEDC